MPAKEVDSWFSFGRLKDGIEQRHSGGKPVRLQVSGVDHPKVIGESNLIPGPVTIVTVPDFKYTNEWTWDLVVFDGNGKRLQMRSMGPHMIPGNAVSRQTDYYFSGNVRGVKRIEIWKRRNESHIIRAVHFTPKAVTK
jgi:hypothetical protein